jgi:hypothetical protein
MWGEDQVARRVSLTITQIAFVVVVGFFSHRHEENEGKRGDVRHKETSFESRNKLGKCDEEKIEVEEELELLVKDDGQEREYIVLLVADNIRRELGL